MTARGFLIAGNWKLNFGVAETTSFIEKLLQENANPPVDVLVCPPFTSIRDTRYASCTSST